MRALFADASFYIALANPRDELNAAAIGLARSLRGQVFTTDFVLLETGNSLSGTLNRHLFTELHQYLRMDPQTVVTPATRELFEAGFALYSERQDKDWSLTDCTSFLVMREHGLTDALTSDHHFEQAGFSALLK